MTDSLVGGVVSLALLLFISITINILFTVHCIYQLRQRKGGSGGEGSGKQSEELYEEVDRLPQQDIGDAVILKSNEAYGEISCQNPTPGPSTAL